MKRPIVLVEWEDAAFTGGWHPKSVTTSQCTTVGYLIEKTKVQVVVALNGCEDGGFGEAMAIPRTCIRSIRRIRK